MKNLELTPQLREPLQALIDSASRINTYKPTKYWYPLSIATYGVEEVLAAVDSLCSFRTSMWEKTAEFERQFAPMQGCSEGIMVNSGSSADLLIALAMVDPLGPGLEPGDEVLVPAVTWPTQVWSLMMAGLRPVLVDCDPTSLNIDIDDMESKIGPRTRGIFAVHLMGNPCDMGSIMRIAEGKANLVVAEDCCEALGARFNDRPVGSFGIASSFSFFFSHHITTMEGGMVCCSEEPLSDVFRLLRAHGWARDTKYLEVAPTDGIDLRYAFLNWGLNVRPTEVQAGFGLEQLRRVPEFHAQRVENARYLCKALDPYASMVQVMQVDAQAECSWFAMPLVVNESSPFSRSELASYLESAGVETRPIVAGSLARHPVCERFPELKNAGQLPGADAIHDRGLYIGIYPFDVSNKLDRLAETFDSFFDRYR